MEINNAIGMRTRSYSPNNGGRSSESTLVSEGYTMWDASGSGSSSRSEDDDDSYRVYSRRIEGNGQWGAWQVSQYPTDWGDGMTGSFCGYDVSIFDTFLYNGVETVGGTSTKKFTATVGSASLELATRLEFWIDADGKLIKKAQTLTNKDVRWELTYSGWGEANAIATPVTSGATPPGGDLPDTGPGAGRYGQPTGHRHAVDASTGVHRHTRSHGHPGAHGNACASHGMVGARSRDNHVRRQWVADIHDSRDGGRPHRLLHQRHQLPRRAEQHRSRGPNASEYAASRQ